MKLLQLHWQKDIPRRDIFAASVCPPKRRRIVRAVDRGFQSFFMLNMRVMKWQCLKVIERGTHDVVDVCMLPSTPTWATQRSRKTPSKIPACHNILNSQEKSLQLHIPARHVVSISCHGPLGTSKVRNQYSPARLRCLCKYTHPRLNGELILHLMLIGIAMRAREVHRCCRSSA